MRTFKFLAIEGCDGAGKSTLAKGLTKYLTSKDHDVLLTSEPCGTPLGKMVKQAIKSNLTKEAELLLFCAARSQHVHDVILPALRAGKIVVCDRYADSTRAYQGTDDFVEDLINRTTSGVKPSLTIIIHGDEEIMQGRAKRTIKRYDSANLKWYKKVQARYLKMAKDDPSHYIVLNADLCTTEELLNAAAKMVEEWLEYLNP